MNKSPNNQDRLLPDISAYHLEESFEIPPEEEKDNKNISIRFKAMTNSSVSEIKQTRSHFFTITNTQGNSLLKMNNMMILESGMKNQSMNRITKIIYEKKPQNLYYLSKQRSYGKIQCDIVTTMIIDRYIFSLFTNPLDREKDSQINCLFLLNSGEKFEFDKLYMKMNNKLRFTNRDKNFDHEKLKEFLDGINKTYEKDDYIKIKSKYKKKKILYMLSGLILFLIATAFAVLGFIYDFWLGENTEHFIYWLVFLCFIIIEFALIAFGFKLLLYSCIVLDDIKCYDIGIFYITNYTNLVSFISEWNQSLFIPNDITVAIPPTMDYLQFNFTPNQEIELEHHEIAEISDVKNSI